MKRQLFPGFLLFFIVNFSLAQSPPSLTDKLIDRAVVGFPNVRQTQLDSIKTELLNQDQVTSAYFAFGNFNCLYVKVDVASGRLKTYYDLIKILGGIYNIEKCYIKPDSAYDESEAIMGTTPKFIIKP